MQAYVQIHGDGVAAACVAKLLADAGIPYTQEAKPRNKIAAILLSKQTQTMLTDIFPRQLAPHSISQNAPPALLDGFHEIHRRVVLWGNSTAPVELPHRGIVAPEEELLRRMWQCVPDDGITTKSAPSWQVQTSAAYMADLGDESLPRLRASIVQARLREGALVHTCWVESVAEGWLFLLDRGEGIATLIATGDEVELLLAKSRLVSEQVRSVDRTAATADIQPRLCTTLIHASTIACGGAAMSFDPLCGEGAGNAIREAFLAAAVVRASLSGQPVPLLQSIYEDRLRRGFLRHLENCLAFYRSGGNGTFWKQQEENLKASIANLQSILPAVPLATHRLVDRDLVTI